MDKNLVAYITTSRSLNISDSDIIATLIKANNKRDAIDDAFKIVAKETPKTIPATMQSAAYSPGIWDTFEHILMFLSLYSFVSAVGLTLSFIVDKWVPGVATDSSMYITSDYSFLRQCLSAFIVSLPIFLYLFLDIAKRTIRNPHIRTNKPRRILIYITLIFSFSILMYEITRIIYHFLSGNVTLNSFLHVAVAIVVIGTVFAYYLVQIKDDRKIYA